MLDQISAFIKDNPRTKAKTIASRLGVDRAELNRLLHAYKDKFEQDAEFQWSLVSAEYRIEFGGSGWLTSWDFESAFSGTSPLTSRHTAVVLVLKDGCKPLLEFLARMLAFCNQLVSVGKTVTLNFEDSKKTLSYLDRVGFFDVLDQAINVLPQRPSSNLSKTYQGNNNGVIEFRPINPTAPDTEIPSLLRNSFVSCAGDSYWQAAFTVLAELFGNVVEHSDTASAGFACLQFYPKGRKIQAVISDNGRGIVGTLAPVVPEKYPHVAQIMASAQHSGVALLTEVFKSGGLSQVDTDGRGIGLKLSGDVAEKFRAKISVRQSDFELRVYHDHNGVQFRHRLNLAHLDGTHICFEFKLDAVTKSA
ncbi:ATP-binding protein [Massilia sp. TN1-12]|uniref:ATP-binding protein n=1 Tax=Massilia paldalensis TaxID=3377675 RepID=UPI00384B0687